MGHEMNALREHIARRNDQLHDYCRRIEVGAVRH
jgi:hypothetical protein